jgi:hypothetical protein
MPFPCLLYVYLQNEKISVSKMLLKNKESRFATLGNKTTFRVYSLISNQIIECT